jgi:hypothetical protein
MHLVEWAVALDALIFQQLIDFFFPAGLCINGEPFAHMIIKLL